MTIETTRGAIGDTHRLDTTRECAADLVMIDLDQNDVDHALEVVIPLAAARVVGPL